MNTDQHEYNKSFEGRARHSVRAVVGVSADGGQRTPMDREQAARPTVPCFLSVSIRVHPWFNSRA